MRVAIVGSGGLGGFFGGLLARAGVRVSFIARGTNLETLRTKGLTVKVPPQGEFHLAVHATDDPGSVGPVDLVWCCVKTYDLEDAAGRMAPLVGSDTVILPIQNGIDAARRIGAVVGHESVIGGLCRGGATLEAPGVVAQKTTRVQLVLGELRGGSSPRTEGLLRRLQAAGIDAALDPRVMVTIWEKFLGVCGTHALTALARLPVGPLLACPAARDLARGLMREAEAVGRATGVALPDDAAEQAFQEYDARAAQNPAVYASVYYDLIAGRRLELEATNGAVVRLGRELGLPTPLNFAVYAALAPYLDGVPRGTRAAE